MQIDYNSLIIGLGVGIIAQKFFNITDKIAKAVKNYQKAEKAKQEKAKSAKSESVKLDSEVKKTE